MYMSVSVCLGVSDHVLKTGERERMRQREKERDTGKE